MPKPKYSYDPACEDLAAHFLADEPGLCTSKDHRQALAQHIQETVEDWIKFSAPDLPPAKAEAIS